jgi:pentatricopeptide repeat protein
MAGAGVQLAASAFQPLFDYYAQAPDGVRGVMAQMEAYGVRPWAGEYLQLMAAYAKRRDLTAARHVLAEMEAAGVPPKLAHYNELLRIHAQLKDISGALAVIDEIHGICEEQAKHPCQISADGVNQPEFSKPTEQTYMWVLCLHAEQKDAESMRRMIA